MKSFAVVLQMAADAVLPRGVLHVELEMVTVFYGDILRDFLVAIETFKGGRIGAESVTGIALRRAT